MFEANKRMKFIANLRIGRININLKKKTRFFYVFIIYE